MYMINQATLVKKRIQKWLRTTKLDQATSTNLGILYIYGAVLRLRGKI